ncbi:MAG: hypothetical protein LBM97_01360 [Candidatus Nomurabacteria bacterium]|jgi:hypothetical protein|nr:hypothetical protein [Candidatus Nomurabacteria bacterium]
MGASSVDLRSKDGDYRASDYDDVAYWIERGEYKEPDDISRKVNVVVIGYEVGAKLNGTTYLVNQQQFDYLLVKVEELELTSTKKELALANILEYLDENAEKVVNI